MLHIIDQFPVSLSSLGKTSYGDTVIFTENAVFAVKQGSTDKSLAQKTLKHTNLCVRKADLLIRNISRADLFKGVAILDDMDYQMVLGKEPAIRSWN